MHQTKEEELEKILVQVTWRAKMSAFIGRNLRGLDLAGSNPLLKDFTVRSLKTISF